jgi:hypothetical protein
MFARMMKYANAKNGNARGSLPCTPLCSGRAVIRVLVPRPDGDAYLVRCTIGFKECSSRDALPLSHFNYNYLNN